MTGLQHTPKILAIDYGQAKIGLAISMATLAEPLTVLRHDAKEAHFATVITTIVEICQKHTVDRIIIGISEGDSARASQVFGKALGQQVDIPIEYYDETFSTQQAQQLRQQAGKHKHLSGEDDDHFAAAVMLQEYIQDNL